MEKRISFYDIEDLIERMDDENLTFDYPIQRADGQWDKSQKALLIDSVLKGFIIPHVYIVKDGTEDFSPMSVLDGKQRLTTLRDFAEDKNVWNMWVKIKKEICYIENIHINTAFALELQIYNLTQFITQIHT